MEDERGRLNRSHQSQVSQIDKYKKLAEEAKRKNDGLETQLSGLRKVSNDATRAGHGQFHLFGVKLLISTLRGHGGRLHKGSAPLKLS